MKIQVASASIPGSAHLGQSTVLIGKNNQDAMRVSPELGPSRIWTGENGPLIALVSDGVSSAPDAEVGSKLAVRLYNTTLTRELMRFQTILVKMMDEGLKLKSDPLPKSFWDRVDNNALAPLSTLMMALGPDDSGFRRTLNDLFIFTMLGLVHSEKFGTWIFGPKGSDGVFSINGEVTILTPQLGNKPISPCYRFVPNEFQEQPDLMQTVVHKYLPPGELESFVIGTDGLEHYIKAEGKKMPGRDEVVHPLSAFWEDEEFYNGDSLQLYFRQLNTESCRLHKPTPDEEKLGKKAKLLREGRLLLDDTTVIIGRRIVDESLAIGGVE